MTRHKFSDAMVMDAGLRETDDGWAAQARVARGGNVQEYRGDELGLTGRGTVRVYRPEGEVFDRKAFNTYARKPITINHPDGGVTPETWADLAVGEIDRDVVRDGEFVSVPLLFRDAKAIALIKSDDGPKELSMGYEANIDFRDGTTDSGEQYDAIMSGFRMNHVAVVPQARGGAELRIGDGAARWGASPIITDRKDVTMADANRVRTVLIDGLSVETTDAGAQALEKLQRTIADMDKAIATANDAHAATVAGKDREIAARDAKIADLEAKVLDDAAIDKRVSARADLVGKARAISADVKTDGLSDAEIRKTAVAAKIGDAKIDGKSDAYIEALFDHFSEAGQAERPDPMASPLRAVDASTWTDSVFSRAGVPMKKGA